MSLKHEHATGVVIAAAIEVHRHLGPGLLESAYRRCLAHELHLRGVAVATEVPIDINYKGMIVPGSFRMDLLAADTVIVEVKSVERVLPVHEAQLLTYLRLARRTLGLLLNFNVPLLKEGITRLIL